MDVAQAQAEPVDADVAEEAPAPEPAAAETAALGAPSPATAVDVQQPATIEAKQEVPPLPPAERAPAAQLQASAPAPAPAPAPPPAPGSLAADEDYLLSLDGSVYVLQIMGSDDAAQVGRFAARQSLVLRQYSKMNAGKRWYALVHGEFSDRAAAERAARDIAAQLPGTQPWLRRLDAVQGEIRQGRAH
jgi:DamX protein